ncbi:MAG: glutamine amidotransferase, partial [Bradymonadaceae bacterium]
DGDETRFDRVKDALERLRPMIEEENDDHHFTVFSYGESLESTTIDGLNEITPEAHAADLTGALEAVEERFDGSDLGGVVVLSDGVDTGAIGKRVRRGETLDETTLDFLARLDAPINTLAAASSEALKDVAIARVLHDDFAFVHNTITVDVELQVIGLGATSFPVTLRRDGEVLQTKTVAIQPDTTRYAVEFEFVPKQIGKEIYSVSVPEFDGEALYENNTHHFVLRVIRDKIRVLQVVGRPSWDQRFLRGFLKRNPNVDLISFFILRTNANPQLVPPNEMSLIPFPTDELFRDELGSFDLVIFQNFNFAPYQMGQYLPAIADFVREGGAFAMVGGDLSFASGGYARTPVEDILPVRLPPAGPRSTLIDTSEFKPNLTDAGHRHPITQLAFEPSLNQEIWEDLPAMRGTNIVHGAIDDGTVLLTHPRLRHHGEPMPVLTVAEMEKGRVMAFTSDSSWRWGFNNVGQGGTPREYQAFWSSAMRWLIKDPELKLVRINIPENIYAPGSLMEGTVRVFAPDYTPAADIPGVVRIFRRDLDSPGGASSRELVETVDFQTDSGGQFILEYHVEEVGIYEIEVEARTAAGELVEEDLFLSVPRTDQYRDIIPRNDLLAALSLASDGHHAVLPSFRPASLAYHPPRFVQVNHRRVVQLWDSLPLFLLIIGLLATEWSLRRRWG